MDIKQQAGAIVNNLKSYYDENRKKVNYISIGVIGITALIVGWNYYYLPKQEAEAAEKFKKIHNFFAKDSFDIVLKGDKKRKITSAVEIADKYSFTKKGNEAALVAGLAYLNKGDFDNALDYLNKVDAKDRGLNPAIIAAKATCYSEKGDYKKAAGLFERAAKESDNDLSAGYYVRAAQHYEKADKLSDALSCYETIAKKYSTAEDGRYLQTAELNIYRLKGLIGDLN